MTSRINTLRDATAARISSLVLPVPVTISSKPFPTVTTEDCRDLALVTVNGSAHQYARDSRGSARHQPIVVVGVHRAIPTDAQGDHDATILDLAIDLVESLADQIMSSFPAIAWARPSSIEIPRIFDPGRLQTDGLFQSGILITFETSVEVES